MKHVMASGAETTDKVEFQASGPNTFNQSLNPKQGSRNFNLDYNLTDDVINCQLAWNNLPAYFNWSYQGHFHLNGTPLVDLTLLIDESGDEDGATFTFDVKLELTTARTLRLTSDGSATGSTVLNVSQYYQIEIRADKTCDGRIYLRIDEVDEVDVVALNPLSTRDSFGTGEQNKQDAIDSKSVTIDCDDLVFWSSTSSGLDELPPWLNTQTCDYRNVDGNGQHNDFVGQDSNSVDNYLNVDEHTPHDADTTFNDSDAVFDVLEKDSYAVQNRVISDTIPGFTTYLIVRSAYDTDNEFDPGGEYAIIVRDDGVDIETNFPQTLPKTFGTQAIGYGERPNGGTPVTDPIIDALEIGLTAKSIPHTDLASYYAGPNSGSPDNASLEPDGVGGEDGDFEDTTTIGGPYAANLIIDNDISDDFSIDHDGDGSTDALFSSTVGHQQSFTVPADTVEERVITGVTMRIFTFNFSPGTGGTIKLYYKNSGGTFFKTATFAVAGAAHYKKTFSTNPDTGNGWAMGEITSGQWGLEIITVDSGKNIQFGAYNVCVNYRSQIRITSAFIVTAHGDALTEFICGVKKKVNSGILGFSKVGGRLVG